LSCQENPRFTDGSLAGRKVLRLLIDRTRREEVVVKRAGWPAVRAENVFTPAVLYDCNFARYPRTAVSARGLAVDRLNNHTINFGHGYPVAQLDMTRPKGQSSLLAVKT